jgi:hypothetical protein
MPEQIQPIRQTSMERAPPGARKLTEFVDWAERLIRATYLALGPDLQYAQSIMTVDDSAVVYARDLLRLGNIDEASQIAEAEIARVSDCGDTDVLWRARFIRAEILSMRGTPRQLSGIWIPWLRLRTMCPRWLLS